MEQGVEVVAGQSSAIDKVIIDGGQEIELDKKTLSKAADEFIQLLSENMAPAELKFFALEFCRRVNHSSVEGGDGYDFKSQSISLDD